MLSEKDVTTTPRIQKTGIRQGCPLSPYFFIMLMTAIMHDAESSLTEQELETTNRDPLHKQVNGKLSYADDTIIMSKTAESGEIILHKIELESSKYSLKLNQNRCIHIQMNVVERIHFMNGNTVPIQKQADYLGGRIKTQKITNQSYNTESQPHGRHSENLTYYGVSPQQTPDGKSKFTMQSSLLN